jgi:hypothetical protein
VRVRNSEWLTVELPKSVRFARALSPPTFRDVSKCHVTRNALKRPGHRWFAPVHGHRSKQKRRDI